jgi:hypothetical protein
LSVFVLNSEATGHSIKFQIRKRRLSTFIRNFGDDGEVNLTVQGGRISGRVEYFGGLQSFSGILNPDGNWNGKFVRQLKKEKVTLLVRRGKIGHQRVSQASKFLHDDSGVLLEDGKRKKSKTKDSQFQIKLTLSPKLEVSGLVRHRSGRHYTRIELNPGGRWNAKGWVRLTGGRFLFSAERGKCQTSFEGTPRFAPPKAYFTKE